MDNVASQPLWVRAVYYASIILPAVMLVVDQIEAYLGTSKALNACERAAGLAARGAGSSHEHCARLFTHTAQLPLLCLCSGP